MKVLETLKDVFKVDPEVVKLQIFDDEWTDWIDILPDDLPQKAKLKLILDEPDTSKQHCQDQQQACSSILKVPVLGVPPSMRAASPAPSSTR